MAHHRADTRASRGRSPVTHSTPPYPVSQGGKRAAGKRAARPAARTAAAPAPAPLVERVVEQAPTPPLPSRPTAPGRRAAARKSLFRGLPSAPILLGIAALAVSAGGAVTVADPQLVGAAHSKPPAKVMQASALSGTGGVATTMKPGARGPVVSRDSRRDAQSDAAGDDVYAAAEAQVKERNAAMAELAKQTEQYAAKLKLNLWRLPVAGYHLTATFGQYGLWSSYHTGLDFAAPSGTPIYAVANGVITSASYDGAYGNKTVQTLEDGTELWYCHQTSYTVSSGETVRAGELIGYIGSTGHVTGPHLHLEVRPGGGDPVDPYSALVVHGITP
jgi:hypothetical protein